MARTRRTEEASEKHELARGLTEEALELYSRGDQAAADRLVERAARIDRSAVEEVVQELEEDAAQRGEN